LLVQAGTLKVGDTIVVGATWGRVKAMFDDKGKRVRKTELADPVEILGLTAVPQVGDVLTAVAGERQAQGLIQKRQEEVKKEFRAINLGNLYDQISAGRVKELNIILKTDVQGSIEPIRTSLEQLGVEEVRVRVVHSGTGNVTESDVMLAIASKGIIVSFGTGCEPGARRLADVEGVSVRSYDVIYDVVDDVGKALRGLLEPSFVEVVEGRAEIRAVFSSGKKTKVAGVYVTEGKVTIGVSVRLRRQEKMVCESVVNSLRRFKDKVKEVAAGYECGIGIENCNDFEVGDILEFFREEEK
jgi:translation initiation factor IF-2